MACENIYIWCPIRGGQRRFVSHCEARCRSWDKKKGACRRIEKKVKKEKKLETIKEEKKQNGNEK